MTKVKSDTQIKLMKESGRILGLILEEIMRATKVGVSTKELNSLANELCAKHNVKPAFLGFNGYPASICASVNDVVVHGLPNNTPLKDGDIIGVDMGVIYKGYYSDSAVTIAVGNISEDAKQLLRITEKALYNAIKIVKNGVKLGDIGNVVAKTAQKHNLGIVKELTGHGIGTELQEDPSIPNYGKPGTGMTLKTGMTIAIEPMFTLKSEKIYSDVDGWTIKTKDKSISAHFEHTVLVLDNGCEILTKRP